MSTSSHAGPTRRRFLSGSLATAGGAAALGAGVIDPAAAADRPDTSPPPPTAQAPDARLRRILQRVDRDRIEDTVRTLVGFGTRHTLSSQNDPERGIGAARDWMFRELRRYAEVSNGRMTVRKQSYVQDRVPGAIPRPTTITNVLATLRGSVNPRRAYVLTGHYDSRVTDLLDSTSDAPGADDDASGVAVAMELARVLADQDPEATIILGGVAGEEQGLFGSTRLARSLRRQGVDVQGMFTCDIVGSSTADDGTRGRGIVRMFVEGVPSSETPEEAEIRVAVGGENDSPARQLGRFVREVAENDATDMKVATIWRRDRYLRGGDHIPFLEEGFPAVRFTEPYEDFRHQHQDVRVEDGVQYGDLVRFCDFDYMAGVARVLGAALWSGATAPGVPRQVRIDARELTNTTTLTWLRAVGPRVAGYEVVWRSTTAAEWEQVRRVGDVDEVTLDVSKDNVFFGVRSVDRQGHHSPAVFPVPLF